MKFASLEDRTKTNYSIRENRYGNWHGYLGKKQVETFLSTGLLSQEQQAQQWLALKIVESFISSKGRDVGSFVRIEHDLADYYRVYYSQAEYLVNVGAQVVRGTLYTGKLYKGV